MFGSDCCQLGKGSVLYLPTLQSVEWGWCLRDGESVHVIRCYEDIVRIEWIDHQFLDIIPTCRHLALDG